MVLRYYPVDDNTVACSLAIRGNVYNICRNESSDNTGDQRSNNTLRDSPKFKIQKILKFRFVLSKQRDTEMIASHIGLFTMSRHETAGLASQLI